MTDRNNDEHHDIPKAGDNTTLLLLGWLSDGEWHPIDLGLPMLRSMDPLGHIEWPEWLKSEKDLREFLLGTVLSVTFFVSAGEAEQSFGSRLQFLGSGPAA